MSALLRYWLHEWNMRRKIRRILRYNKKHPEECFSFEDFLLIREHSQEQGLWEDLKPLTPEQAAILYRGDE